MSTPTTTLPRLAALSPLLVWAFLFLIAWRTTQSAYALVDLAALALLYGLVAVALVAGARAVAALAPPARFGGALMPGLVLGWHLREQTRIPGAGATLWTARGVLEFLPAVLLIGTAFLLIERIVAGAARDRGTPARRSLLQWGAATAAFFVLLGAGCAWSNTLRWHLLRHNHMIGSVAFPLFEEPVAEIEARDWRQHGRGAPIGQPDWVHDLYGDAGGDGERRPDVVFVMLDTLRADGLAAYGGDPSWMPALNRLADDSLLFTEVIANSSWTRPSVASFFTGLPQEEHGALSVLYRIAPTALTLAEVLDAQGYETAAFVANGVIVDEASGYRRGFDTFEFIGDRPRNYARADIVTDRVSGWLTTRRRQSGTSPEPSASAPLFLYVHYFDPHVPYMSTREDGDEIYPEDTDDAHRYYADELRFLDAELSRLLAALDTLVEAPRLVLVTSDHGEEFGEHDGMGHSQTLYSEVIDIPVIVHDASGTTPPPRGRIDAPLEGRDFFYMLLRATLDGPLDIAAWARQAARPERFASLSFTKDPGRSELIHALVRPYRHRIYDRLIQRGDWRLIWSAFGETDELYDLAADPAERRNIARDHPGMVESLRATLDATPPYWVRPTPVDLSDERLEELRALGYIR